ncbi:MAG: tRNA pseudouridine(55) synthase TruB [Bacteroidota bacterium]|nr:tRNA pseudouridine(55) synthase TruB [Bacteroidota bacterium]
MEDFSKRTFDFRNGELLLLDKPLTWTSFDVVNKIRYTVKRLVQIKRIKVGHAGTLDPLATGLLIICTGKMTKQIDSFTGMPKEYTGTFKLGEETSSYDRETEVSATYDISNISEEDLETTRKKFLGKIDQFPPIFSAKKIKGKKAYEYARKNEKVEIKSNQIEIFEFELTKIDLPHVEFRVVCSKGTYIRSLAYDFGKTLNNGAVLTELRRTKIGDYKIEDAYNVKEFSEYLQSQDPVDEQKRDNI